MMDTAPSTSAFISKNTLNLFENALKFYIQKEDACGFQEFFVSNLRKEASNQSSIVRSTLQSSRKKTSRTNSTNEAFSFAKLDHSNELFQRNSSNPRTRRFAPSHDQESPQVTIKKLPHNSEGRFQRERISPRRREGSQVQIKDWNSRLTGSVKEMSPEKLEIYPDDSLEQVHFDSKYQSPYDPDWIEKIMKKNFNMKIQCENEQNHINYGAKPKWKAFRISIPSVKPIIPANSERNDVFVEENTKFPLSPVPNSSHSLKYKLNNSQEIKDFNSEEFKEERISLQKQSNTQKKNI